jgi:hypothetical protein
MCNALKKRREMQIQSESVLPGAMRANGQSKIAGATDRRPSRQANYLYLEID